MRPRNPPPRSKWLGKPVPLPGCPITRKYVTCTGALCWDFCVFPHYPFACSWSPRFSRGASACFELRTFASGSVSRKAHSSASTPPAHCIHDSILYAICTYHSQGMSISLGRALAIHIPTLKARRKTLSMLGKLYVLYTEQQYEHLACRNSATLIAESHVARARQLSTEARVLIAQVRSALAENKVLRARVRDTIDLAQRTIARSHYYK
jgi:hypothetical protein